MSGDGHAPELTLNTTEAALQTAIALWCTAIARWYAAVPLVGPHLIARLRSPEDALSYISMILTIAYFAEPSTPDAQPAIPTGSRMVALPRIAKHLQRPAIQPISFKHIRSSSIFPTALLNDMFGMVNGGGRKMPRGRAGLRPALPRQSRPVVT